jgi:hypothetical protein
MLVHWQVLQARLRAWVDPWLSDTHLSEYLRIQEESQAVTRGVVV